MAAPKNASTRVPTSQTIGEIQALLMQHDAEQVMLTYRQRRPSGLTFRLHGEGYHLPARLEAMERRLEGNYPRSGTGARDRQDYAAAVAWRTIRDWLAAQLDLIDTGMVSLDEVLLPFRLVDGQGTTVYAAMKAGQLALPASADGV